MFACLKELFNAEQIANLVYWAWYFSVVYLFSTTELRNQPVYDAFIVSSYFPPFYVLKFRACMQHGFQKPGTRLF